MQHYNHIANQNKLSNESAYKSWISTYTPETIRKANFARIRLASQAKTSRTGKYAKIRDDRHIKRPVSAFAYFSQARWASGDLKGMAFTDAGKLVASEYKALSEAERQV
jgi:hypothetical protein